MTVRDIIQLRKQGHSETAYEAARRLYAIDKGPETSTVMFWTAVDVLRQRVAENRMDEAHKIFLALQRLVNSFEEKDNRIVDTMNDCETLIKKSDVRNEAAAKLPDHLQTGAWGEDLAAAYLREKGYVILERDWHSKHRDIDIVARDGECIVFVEVKTRSHRDFLDPVFAVDYKKLRNLRLAINHYINYHHIDTPYRFDVITIVGKMTMDAPEIEHIENFNLL